MKIQLKWILLATLALMGCSDDSSKDTGAAGEPTGPEQKPEDKDGCKDCDTTHSVCFNKVCYDQRTCANPCPGDEICMYGVCMSCSNGGQCVATGSEKIPKDPGSEECEKVGGCEVDKCAGVSCPEGKCNPDTGKCDTHCENDEGCGGDKCAGVSCPEGKCNPDTGKCEDTCDPSTDDCDSLLEDDDPSLSMNSLSACHLDSDCDKGSFCFHNTCTVQCEAKDDCAAGYLCSLNTGRCVLESFVKAHRLRHTTLEASKLNDYNLAESANSTVVASVIGHKDSAGKTIEGISILKNVQENLLVDPGQKVVSVDLVTTNDLGDVQYIVRSSEGTSKPKLQIAKMAKIDQSVGGESITAYKYTFDIKPVVSNLTEITKSEAVTIDSGAGAFQVALKPRPAASGMYEGNVFPESILSGTPLPIRMRIETVPATPKSLFDIKEATLWLPVSGSDLFSPQSVVDKNKTVWVSAAKWESNSSPDPVPTFAFATNEFELPAGKLFSRDDKVTRSIRVEFDDYDVNSQEFTGRFKDTIANLYRVNKFENGKPAEPIWSQVDMEAQISVKRVGALDDYVQMATHVMANESDARPLTGDPFDVCTDTDIAKLAALIPSESDPASCDYELSVLGSDNVDECKGAPAAYADCLARCEDPAAGCTEDQCKAPSPECTSYLACEALIEKYDTVRRKVVAAVSTLDAYNHLVDDDEAQLSADELRDFFVKNAARGILGSDNLVSSVLKPILENKPVSASLPAECGQISTIEEFSTACMKDDCTLCQERHEITCAADLIARNYMANGDDKAIKANKMETWLKLMRESYLADEYLAWARDTQIREAWLTGTVFSSAGFTSSLLSDKNNALLASYVSDVLDRQKKVMMKQFTQTSLEMLSQVLNDQNMSGYDENARQKMIANRNDILAEMASTWKAVGEGLSLVSRRNDVFLQNDDVRMQKAKELRPYLFDLYFAGLVESNINRDAGKGSLNAGYGTVLTNTLSNLASLDQTMDDKVFMRDGEVLVDTSGNPNQGMLETRKKNAEKYVSEAKTSFEAVRDDHTNKLKERLQIKDDYATALETYKSQIVNLCGLPVECKEYSSCDFDAYLMPYTAPFYCGFNVAMKDTSGAPTAGGNLLLETDRESKNKDAGTSLAGAAILAYRQAYNDYLAAKDELDVAEKRVNNTGQYLDGYAVSIASWYRERSNVLNSIKNNLNTINSIYSEIGELDSQIEAAKLEEAQAEYNKQESALGRWKSLAKAQQGVDDAAAIAVAAATTTGIWTEYAATEASNAADELLQVSELGTTVAGAGFAGAFIVAKNTAAALHAVKAAADTAVVGLQLSKEIADNAFQFEMDLNEKQTTLDIAKLQLNLQNAISKLEAQQSEKQSEIDTLKQLNEQLKANNANQEIYERDLNNLKENRKDYLNEALGLIPLQRMVKVKEIAMYRALIDYLTISQNAQMIATQYQAKNERFKAITDIIYAPDTFFAYASDLEAVETTMERARDAISDYIAALEYTTVRPYVDLRLANYIARGHNDFTSILNSLEDVDSNCHFGTSNVSNNKVTISLRNRMGIYERDFNDLSPADRFHYAMSTSTLPISMQTRYSIFKTLKDLTKGPKFYAGTFTIDENFANLSSACDAKINSIKARLVSKPGAVIRDVNNAIAHITVFYGGQTKLVACHDIDALVKSIGSRTTFGNVSSFKMNAVAASGNVAIYHLPESEADYVLTSNTDFSNATEINGFAGYPLMSSYTVMFDPTAGENSGIDWSSVGDIELELTYTTSNIDSNRRCTYQ